MWQYPPDVDRQLVPALLTLTEHQRAAVVLRHAYGMTYAEVAAFMGISITTVQNQVERGLKQLRRALDGKEASCETTN